MVFTIEVVQNGFVLSTNVSGDVETYVFTDMKKATKMINALYKESITPVADTAIQPETAGE